MSPTINATTIEDPLVNTIWAIRITYHTVLKSTPGAAIFGRDMSFNIPYVADWNEIGRHRHRQVESTNKCENQRRLPNDYAIGLNSKKEFSENQNQNIRALHNYTSALQWYIRIQRSSIFERIKIRRLTPYME